MGQKILELLFLFFSVSIINPLRKTQVTLPTFCFGPMNLFLEINIIVSFVIYIYISRTFLAVF